MKPVVDERKFARELMGRLPTKVRIGLYDFTLLRWDHHQATGAGRYGECSSIEQTIRVQHDMPTRYKAVDTVLHEFNHAIFWSYGVSDDDKEERTVTLTSTGWAALFRDNAWLLEWIKSAKL